MYLIKPGLTTDYNCFNKQFISNIRCNRGCRGHDRMVVSFMTNYEIGAYQN